MNTLINPALGRRQTNPASVLAMVWRSKAPEFRKAGWFALASSLLMIIPAIFMLEIYGRVINSGSLPTLYALLLFVSGAYLVIAMIDYARSRVMQLVGWQVDAELRAAIHDALFQEALREGVGSQVALNDLRTVREFLGSPLVSAFLELPAALLFLIFVSVISPWLGAVALAGAIIQVAIGLSTERQTAPRLEQADAALNTAQTYAAGVLRQTRVILALGMLEPIYQRWIAMHRRFLRLQADVSDTAGANAATSKLIQTMQSSLILGGSCLLTVTGVMTIEGGQMIVASTLGGRVLVPIIQLVGQWRLFVSARQSYHRLDAMLSEAVARPSPMPLTDPIGQLTAEAVSVAAPGGGPLLLRNVSFTLAAGETLAVIGPSGAGKTCLLRVLAGAWTSTAGKVRLDGADLTQWDPQKLGRHVGYLPQAVELLDGTLAENIARFTEPDAAMLERACSMAGLDGFVAHLRKGLMTEIGDEGCFLSGGQRQRVGLARAIYGMPRLVVLDEPNASLDDAGEKALSEALRALRESGATVVLVTHRANLVTHADKILVLRDGQVVALGPRDDVLAAMRQPPASRPGMPPSGVAKVGP